MKPSGNQLVIFAAEVAGYACARDYGNAIKVLEACTPLEAASVIVTALSLLRDTTTNGAFHARELVGFINGRLP